MELYLISFYLNFSAAGEVYRAINKSTNAQVAIKRMILEKQQRKDMIVTEIQGEHFLNIFFIKPNLSN